MVALAPAAPPPLRPGAVVHGPGSEHIDALLDRFTAELKRRGFRVGGLVQRNYGGGDDCADQMDLVDVATGRAFGISQHLGRESQACRVDPRGVAEASQALRRAVAERADLIVVNKFAGLEAHGEGLSDEMLSAISEGIPLLTSVGSRYINEWQSFAGGYADLLTPDAESLWRWWGPHRLYEDLLLGVEDAEVKRVVVGAKWILVETVAGAIGLAARPSSSAGAAVPAPESWAGWSLKALAEPAARGWDALEVAIGIAALNAHYNHAGLTGPAVNGLDQHAGAEGRVVVIGGFPKIRERLPRAQVIEIDPRPGEYPEPACDWLLPGAEAVVTTASALANRTLPRLLAAGRGARVTLVGPGTPLTPRLFDYGIETLSGFVAENVPALVEAILGGASSKQFHCHGRFVTLSRG
ncbi:DUF2478 domain-containing protein [Azospirillum sp.]|uniref:DUF2478 domain-containing protein n=1 Tax=Azospirillum sp. TaxID=34012 RepID=UPI003D748429